MKITLILHFILIGHSLFGQEFSRRDFKNTHWFTNNADSLFFAADTLILIKALDKGPKWLNYEYQENVYDYLGHCLFVTLEFQRAGRFDYWVHFDCPVSTVSWAGNTWRFDRKEQSLYAFEKKDIFFILKPLKKEKIVLPSWYSDEGISAEKWMFRRIEN